MASGTPVNLYVVESIVESVYNSKIPDLMEVMRDARAETLSGLTPRLYSWKKMSLELLGSLRHTAEGLPGSGVLVSYG